LCFFNCFIISEFNIDWMITVAIILYPINSIYDFRHFKIPVKSILSIIYSIQASMGIDYFFGKLIIDD